MRWLTRPVSVARGLWAGIRRRRLARWTLGGVATLVLAFLVLGGVLQAAYSGRILPNTQVAGVEVGGMKPAAATDRLSGTEAGRTLTLARGERRFTVRAEDVGYRVNARVSAQRARAAGRGGPLGGLGAPVVALWTSRTVAPEDAVDGKRLDAAVSDIAARADRPLSYGELDVDAETLEVEAVPPRPGYRVDRDATAAAVVAGLRRNSPDPLPLPVETTAVDPARVEAVAGQAREFLRDPLRLSGGGEKVEISPRQLAPVLAVEPVKNGEGPDVRLGVGKKPLGKLLASVADEVDRPAVETRISAPAVPVVLDNKGDLTWQPRPADVDVRAGRRGKELNRSAARKTIGRLVRDGKHRGKLPLRREDPEVPAAAARRVTSLIGTFTTHFACCQPRVTNIRLIAQAVDGTVIMPGEKFSLNDVAGPRTREKGYVPAPFIYRGELVPDVGGGTSQLSTTMYNAAYFAGLPVGSFTPHSFYISRYPPGRESTLNYPTIDLTWTNDTDAPVLVRAATTKTSVTVSLYGDNGGREVAAVSSQRKPWDQGDFQITVTRAITYPDGRVARYPYTTRYDEPPEEDD